ncbi:MAG: hypothetical protein WCD18_02845 [Thermosynechococcaceae cyanobacterium]
MMAIRSTALTFAIRAAVDKSKFDFDAFRYAWEDSSLQWGSKDGRNRVWKIFKIPRPMAIILTGMKIHSFLALICCGFSLKRYLLISPKLSIEFAI